VAFFGAVQEDSIDSIRCAQGLEGVEVWGDRSNVSSEQLPFCPRRGMRVGTVNMTDDMYGTCRDMYQR
jgi:hypothetical protein